jgi:hypothetical protein
MESQYCRVGATNSITADNQGLDWLESQYHHFLAKAEAAGKEESRLRDFFQKKAQQLHLQIQSYLQS